MLVPDLKLSDYSKEHLHYEIQMFFDNGTLLRHLTDIPPGDPIRGTIKNALIESFVIHLRNLLSFLRGSNRKGAVSAKDFFEKPHEWHLQLPPSLESDWGRADEEVAHLTTSRIDGNPPAKDWKSDKRMKEVRTLLEDFVARASPHKLDPSVKDFVVGLELRYGKDHRFVLTVCRPEG